MPRITVTLLSCLLANGFAAGAPDLFEGFKEGWREKWQEETHFTKPTLYTVEADEAGRAVLFASSTAAHAGLVRQFALPAPTRAILRWRWKIDHALTGNVRERSREGDDYAARVFVVFETSVWPLRTRAINYVWAAHEPVGTTFASPYTKNVGMVVVRSGDQETGAWHEEDRDVLADYRKYFGEPASRISAVAILVDTDNTGRTAKAWFADLTLETTPALMPGTADH